MRRFRTIDIIISGAICLFGAYLIYSGITKSAVTIDFTLFAGGIILLTGIFSIVQTLRFYYKEELTGFGIITLDSERIVWLYYSKLNLMPFGVDVLNRCQLFVCTIDGRIFTLRANEKIIIKTIAEVLKENPSAVTGFSVEKEQLFKVDPRLLRKD